jgi:hypothetical protein
VRGRAVDILLPADLRLVDNGGPVHLTQAVNRPVAGGGTEMALAADDPGDVPGVTPRANAAKFRRSGVVPRWVARRVWFRCLWLVTR